MPLATKREDYAMWLVILRTRTEYMYGLQETLTYYRLTKNSGSRNKFDLIKYQYRLFRDFEHFPYCVRHTIPLCDA